jgi:CRISPR/Cas system CSM-associated protein Csm3 (group 7 of RAMP superfamily)
MLKKLLNFAKISFDIVPQGPLLVKSGVESADPTRPDMEFVRSYHAGGETVYFPNY